MYGMENESENPFLISNFAENAVGGDGKKQSLFWYVGYSIIHFQALRVAPCSRKTQALYL